MTSSASSVFGSKILMPNSSNAEAGSAIATATTQTAAIARRRLEHKPSTGVLDAVPTASRGTITVSARLRIHKYRRDKALAAGVTNPHQPHAPKVQLAGRA